MRLTLSNKIKLCVEILTARRCCDDKILSTFQRGYVAGLKDAMFESLVDSNRKEYVKQKDK